MNSETIMVQDHRNYDSQRHLLILKSQKQTNYKNNEYKILNNVHRGGQITGLTDFTWNIG